MRTGFGIVGLLVGIVAVFVPIGTLFVMWLALALVTASAFLGDKIFATVTVAVTLLNLLFLSPLTLLVIVGSASAAAETGQGSISLLVITVVLFIAPIVGLISSQYRGK